MKAILCRAYGPPETLTLEDVADPVPGPGEICVDIRAAALNFPDVLVIQNKYQVKPPLPFSPGVELAGFVSGIGAGVSGFKIGDRIACFANFGGFAEKAVVRAHSAVRLADGISFEHAATLPVNYSTSHYALSTIGTLQKGETLLVLGASGGVGLAAVQIGKAMGARVIAAASSPDKLAICQEHGADLLVDYSAQNLRDAMRSLAPDGANLVYDPVGGAYSEAAVRSLAWRGRFLVIGFANGEIPRLPLNLVLLKEAHILGVAWGASVARDPALYSRTMQDLMVMMTNQSLTPVISERIGLADVPKALRAMMDRKVTGKVVVSIG